MGKDGLLCKFRMILLTRRLLELGVLNISRPFGIRAGHLGLRGGFVYRPASHRWNWGNRATHCRNSQFTHARELYNMSQVLCESRGNYMHSS